MQVFKIKLSSALAYSLTSMVILLSGMFTGVYMALTHANDVYFFLLFLFGLPALVFIPDLLSTALTQWSISEKEIEIRWLSRFLFQKKPGTTIRWENIEEYVFQPQRRFSYFKLKLRDNTVLKYWHNDSVIDDQFDEFLAYFKKEVSDYNQRGINILHAIKRGKTIYETRGGIAFAVIFAILMISFPILVSQVKLHNVQWIYVVSFYSGGLYFISQVISHFRSKRQQQHKA